jgi:phosphohistidine phosphatase
LSSFQASKAAKDLAYALLQRQNPCPAADRLDRCDPDRYRSEKHGMTGWTMSDDKAKPFRLFLLRHAHAAWAQPGERDFDRNLDEAGRREAERVRQFAGTRFAIPSHILCSPANRCRQTLQALLPDHSTKTEPHYAPILFSGQIDDYLSEMKRFSDGPDLLLIGHNPVMEHLLIRLVGENSAKKVIPDGYPTAGLAVIDVQLGFIAASGSLVEMIRP